MDWGAHVALAWACAACACTPSVFQCQDDEGCGGAAPGGVCEAPGYCSFPDEACSSGRRYGEGAGEGLAGGCVNPTEQSSTGAENPSTSTTAQPGPTSDSIGSEGSTGSETDSSESTSAAPQCPEDWWDCAWTRRQPLTLEAMPLAEPLTSLPIPVRVDPTLSQDPSLVLVDPSGVALPWEFDGGLIWVSVSVEPDTPLTLWAYGGNPTPSRPSKMPVWDSTYAAVWHLEDGADASGSGNVAVSEEVVHAACYFERGAVMDGIDDRFDVAATEALADLRTDGFTIEAWLEPDPDSTDGYRRILDKADDPNSTLGWSLMLRGDAPLHQLEINYGYDTDERQYLTDAFEVAGWVHLVVVTHPGDDAEFWLDGQPLPGQVTTPGLGLVPSDAMQPATIGAPTTGVDPIRFLGGRLDELRISRGVRSASWVAATYTSGRPDAVTVGGLESLNFDECGRSEVRSGFLGGAGRG